MKSDDVGVVVRLMQFLTVQGLKCEIPRCIRISFEPPERALSGVLTLNNQSQTRYEDRRSSG